jgi:surface adhesion protein
MIFGNEGEDDLYTGDGHDVLSGGEGADNFILHALQRGVDVIRDFKADDGDVLDFSAILQGRDGVQDAINNFIFARDVGGGTILSVDVTGSGNADNAVELVALEGLHNIDIQDMLSSGNINIM